MSEDVLETDVIIIGGGISGVAAAHRLLYQSDTFKGKVTILEAQDWLGGRIHSTIIAGKMLELGANWIHGIIDNPIYNIAWRANLIDPLEIHKSHQRYNIIGRTGSGESIPFSKIVKIYEIYFGFIKKCENYFHSLNLVSKESDKELTHLSVGEAIQGMIEEYIKTVPEEERELNRKIFQNFINRENVITACDSLDEISLKDFGAYEEFPGGNVTIPEGYYQIIGLLIDEIKLKLKAQSQLHRFDILTNHKVDKINWNGIGSTQTSKIKVICDNQTEFFCDHLIITFSLGVLKTYHEQMFHPSLPQYKIDCIQRSGFGTVEKIFLVYDQPLSPKFIDKGVEEILPFWNLKEDRNYQWPFKIYSFTKVSEVCLLVWVTGNDARFIEKRDNWKIGRDITIILRSVLKRPNLPEPVSVLKTNWGSDPLFLGSYSYIALNSSISDIDHLSQPIYSNPNQEKVYIETHSK